MKKHSALEEMERKENLRSRAMKTLMFTDGDSLENNVLRVLVVLNDQLAMLSRRIEALEKAKS